MLSLIKTSAVVLMLALAGCMEAAADRPIDQTLYVGPGRPVPYNEQVIYDGQAYRLVFMTPQGTIRPGDQIVRYRFGIMRLENKGNRPLWVRPVTYETYAGTGYRATIGTGSTQRVYASDYERELTMNLIGPDETDPLIVPPGHSVRIASYGIRDVLALIGAFGFREAGRPLAPLDRICPSFEGYINVKYATQSGTQTEESAGGLPIGRIKVQGPCYGIDSNRDWAADWNASFEDTVDVHPNWEAYPTPRR